MPTYFFKAHDRFGAAPDLNGLELPDLAAVHRQAVAGARSLICDDIRQGILDLSGAIEVTDEEGETVLLLRFDEVVTQH